MTFLDRLFDWLWHLDSTPVIIHTEPVTPPQPQPTQPKPDLLTLFCKAQEDFEGGPNDLNHKNNNPGNLKKLDGTFFKFKTYDEGFQALKDYVTRVAKGQHKAYPNPCTIFQYTHVYTGDPEPAKTNYANFLAKRIGKTTGFYIHDLIS